MTRRLGRTTAWWTIGVLVAALLSACSDPQDDYCDALKDARQQLLDLSDRAAEKGGAGLDTLGPTLEILDDLRSEAPDELQDEWDTLVLAYQDLADAVTDSGLDPSDLGSADALADLTPAQRRRLRALAGTLTSPRVVEATQGIEDHAREVCDVEFDA